MRAPRKGEQDTIVREPLPHNASVPVASGVPARQHNTSSLGYTFRDAVSPYPPPKCIQNVESKELSKAVEIESSTSATSAGPLCATPYEVHLKRSCANNLDGQPLQAVRPPKIRPIKSLAMQNVSQQAITHNDVRRLHVPTSQSNGNRPLLLKTPAPYLPPISLGAVGQVLRLATTKGLGCMCNHAIAHRATKSTARRAACNRECTAFAQPGHEPLVTTVCLLPIGTTRPEFPPRLRLSRHLLLETPARPHHD